MSAQRKRHFTKWITAISFYAAVISSCSPVSKITTTVRSKPAAATSTSGPHADVKLTSISLSANTVTPYINQSITVTAKGTYSDQSSKDLTGDVSWSVSSPHLKLSSTPGLMTANAEGSVTVTASYQDVSGKIVLDVGNGDLVSIVVVPGTGPNRMGVTQAFTALGIFKSGAIADITSTVTWSSNNAAVASVDSTTNLGVTSYVAAGTTTITASKGGVSGGKSYTVDTPTLTSISISPSTLLLAAGYTTAVSATGVYSDGARIDLTSSATWSSGTTAASTVNNTYGSKGFVSGIAAGSSTLTATVLGITGTSVVNTTAATLSSMTITPSTLTLAQGTTSTLHVDGTFSDASKLDLSPSSSWDSSTSSVSVNNVGTNKGLITAVQNGTATIHATQNAVSATSGITVSSATLQSIAVTPATTSIAATGRIQMKAVGTFSDASTQDLTSVVAWSSSNLAAAVITSNSSLTPGIAAGIAAGTSTITAAFEGINGSTALTVNPAAAATLSSITITPATTTLSIGAQLQFTATGIFSDGSLSDITATAAWSTGNAAILQNDGVGLFTALTGGTTSIKATKSGISGSTLVTATVSQAAPPTPTGLAANPISGSQINYTWTSAGGTTASYRYSYVQGAVHGGNCNTATSGTTSQPSVSITGLTANTQYTLIVCAQNANTTPLLSAQTAGATATTLAAPPPNVTGLSAANDSASQVTISWTSGGGTTATYKIAYQTGATAPADCNSGTTTTSISTSKAISGLTGGTQYSFRVCALNSNPTPDQSAGTTVSSTPGATPPNVTALSASNDSASQVTLSWTSGGGSTATYKIASQTGATAPADCNSGTTTTSGSASKAITGLTGGTQYSFRVCALNSNGTPEMSSGTTVSSTPAALPPNVTGLSASNDTASQVTLNWTSGGGSTSSYKIAYQTGASAPADCNTGTTSTSGTTSKTISSLTGGTQYSFRVCALNNNSTPDMSSGATVSTTPAAAPPNVTGLGAVVASASEIDLSWTSGGGSTATYKIAYQSGATAPTDCASGTTTTSGTNSKAIMSLTASTQYSFRVCALNSNVTPEVSSGVTVSATTSAGGGGTSGTLTSVVAASDTSTSAGTIGARVTHVQLTGSDGLLAGDNLIIYSAALQSSGALVTYERNNTILFDNVQGGDPAFDVPSSPDYSSEMFFKMVEGGSTSDTYRITGWGGGGIIHGGRISAISFAGLTKNTHWVSSVVATLTGNNTDTLWHDLTSVTIPAGNMGKKWVIMAETGGSTQTKNDHIGLLQLAVDGATYFNEVQHQLMVGAITSTVHPRMYPILYTVPDNSTHVVHFQYQAFGGENPMTYTDINLLAFNADVAATFADGQYLAAPSTNATDTYGVAAVSKSITFPAAGNYLILGSHNQANTALNYSMCQLTVNSTVKQVVHRLLQQDINAQINYTAVYNPGAAVTQPVNIEFKRGTSDGSTSNVFDASLIVLGF